MKPSGEAAYLGESVLITPDMGGEPALDESAGVGKPFLPRDFVAAFVLGVARSFGGDSDSVSGVDGDGILGDPPATDDAPVPVLLRLAGGGLRSSTRNPVFFCAMSEN